MTVTDADLRRADLIGLSRVLHHGAACCTAARSVLFARLGQFLDVGSALAAVPELIRWGPTRWPVHWCDLDLSDGGELTGDCGVHADVASELLRRFGVEHKRGRAAVVPNEVTPKHWQASWRDAETCDPWIGPAAIHHEVVRVGDRWWDPTEARWFDGPGSWLASGRVVAVRDDDGAWQVEQP